MGTQITGKTQNKEIAHFATCPTFPSRFPVGARYHAPMVGRKPPQLPLGFMCFNFRGGIAEGKENLHKPGRKRKDGDKDNEQDDNTTEQPLNVSVEVGASATDGNRPTNNKAAEAPPKKRKQTEETVNVSVEASKPPEGTAQETAEEKETAAEKTGAPPPKKKRKRNKVVLWKDGMALPEAQGHEATDVNEKAAEPSVPSVAPPQQREVDHFFSRVSVLVTGRFSLPSVFTSLMLDSY